MYRAVIRLTEKGEGLVEELRGEGLHLFVLSDISRGFAARARAGGIPMLQGMEGCVFSAECGRVKPTQEAFLGAAADLGIRPEETLFVDDRQANADGAAACGFLSYRFDGDADALRAYIRSLQIRENERGDFCYFQ